MRLEVKAEYACGHPTRVVSQGECRRETMRADLKRITDASSKDGVMDFNCHCGRGAAFIELWLDGRLIDRTPASAFLGTEGVKMTVREEKP